MNWPTELLESGISSYLSVDVPTVDEAVSAPEAAKKVENPYGVVLVTGPNRSLKGIITRSNLIKLTDTPPPTTALELATTDKVVAIAQEAQLWQLLKIINGENKAGKPLEVLPVVDRDTKKPIGVIRRETLRASLPEKLATFKKGF